MDKTGFIYHPLYLKHETEPHPENPGRLTAIVSRLEELPIGNEIVRLEPRPADLEEISLVHDRGYANMIREQIEGGADSLDIDTRVGLKSFDAALLSAGAGLSAVDHVVGKNCKNVFCAVRPPGHHAEKKRSMGFCIFNNVAIAARYAQNEKGLNRIAIFDWDVHHGNGTQNAFYDDPTVFYSSAHQYPFYPGTGGDDETGTGNGLGSTLNLPLRAFSGDGVYLDAVENKVIPELIKFNPDLIIISAGFDAHKDDPLGGMDLSTECFGTMTNLLLRASEEICEGRLISMLEGGYNHSALTDSVLIHLKNLMDAPQV